MDFFARQEHAKKKTRQLIVYLLIAVLCIIIAINALVYAYMLVRYNQSYELSEWIVQPQSLVVTIATILIITIISFIQWCLLREGGDALAVRMGATPVLLDAKDSSKRQLLNVVEEMSIASGIVMPNLYVMEHERGINAFVAGLNQSDAVLVVTDGAIRALTRQELQGVVGHEFSHIFNSDMRINLQLISLLSGILFLSEAGRFVFSSAFDNDYRSSRHQSAVNPFIFLLPMAVILFAVGSVGLFFARLIKSSISRQREYLADAAAVQYTRDNQGLASALFKISQFSEGSTLHTVYAEEASHMCFSEPVSLFSGFLNGLLSTHPPVEKRIKAICPGWIPGKEPRVRGKNRNQVGSHQSNSLPQSVVALVGNQQVKSKHHLTQTIGRPTSQHLQEAQRIIQGIPASLRITTTTTEPKEHSLRLVLALLLTDDGQQTYQALADIKQIYGSAFSQTVREFAEQIQQQPRKQRFAIFELAMPVLKQLTRSERKTLFETLRKIIQLDNTISRFEYTLYWLLKKHLYGQTKQAKPSINSLKIVPNEVAIVIAMMIEASGKNETSRRKIFSFIMTNLGLSQMLMPVTEFDADVIHKAVMVLAQLNPIPKQSLLYALEDCVTEDKIVAPEEAELLRTIAELMDCPIPPLLVRSAS